ncbi:hypothetical protein MTR67_022308 [Solanum verrucosum]|uniref:Uncharacterized protein n=1 Tax=Solanum verrucosum TaxID=315347 RepID=A0AAF0QV50_SOLVR|nr:hypothetical protein MTR67_022308 [Solanum verrucosum]
MFMLKKYHKNEDYIVKRDSIVLDKDLHYEEDSVQLRFLIEMLELRTNEIKLVKIQVLRIINRRSIEIISSARQLLARPP